MAKITGEKERIQEFLRISYERSKSAERRGNLDLPSGQIYQEAGALLLDLKNTPHAFVLAEIMSPQIRWDKAALIPYKVFIALKRANLVHSFSIDDLAKVKLSTYQNIFDTERLHRFKYMAEWFYLAVQRIKTAYNSNAAKIWSGKPASKEVIKRLRAFKGIGQKVSADIAKGLVTCFGIEFSDYHDIDIPLDVHVIRIMKKLGLVKFNGDEAVFKNEILQKTRAWSPEFPAVFDYACWSVGRVYCKDNCSDCNNCPLKNICDESKA